MSKIHKSMLVAAALCSVSLYASGLVVVNPPPPTNQPPPNQPPPDQPPPDCSGVAPTVLWPPNHQMVKVSVVGVNQSLAILINKITQDEPVDGLGDGDTSPDAILPDPLGTNTNTAMIRAERAGPGTGRIYFISFSATDTTGLQCTGTALVYVPHDQGQGVTPIDTGRRFDSTQTL
jgi:hypothetical protein